MSSLWGLCQRLLDKCPNFCHFLILLYNFVFNVNWLANILLEPLLIYGFNNFQYFQPFLGSLWSFPAWTCHNPSNIHFSLLNPIKLPLKFIKSFWNTFWIMFKGSVWFLHCLKKAFLDNRSSRVSPFSDQYSRYSSAGTTKQIHPQENTFVRS